jgi:cathepsin L
MQYVSKYGKSYTNVDEFNLRLSLFTARDKIIKEWNADLTNTSRMGHNFLSDYTEAEQANLRGLVGEPKERTASEFKYTNQALPSSVNWVTAGHVGAVKDQGQCGSCWAFSATGTVESSVSIATGAAPGNYSEQQLVSCANGQWQSAGCNGGWYYWAWDYLKVNAQAYGKDYPYTSGTTKVDGTCESHTGHVTVASYV